MEQRRIGFFTRFKEAISNFNFANIIIKERTSVAIKYFLLLILAISIVSSIFAFNVTRKTLFSLGSKIEKELPNFELINGKLSMDGNEPFIFDDGDLIVIDTTGATTMADLKAKTTYKTIILFDSSKVYYYSPSDQYKNRTFDLASFNVDLDKQEIIDYLKSSSFLPTMVAVIAILIIVIGKMFGSIVSWIIASIIASSKKIPLTSGQTYALALYALTVPSLVKFAISSFVQIPYFWIFYYGITVYYLFKYLDAIKKDSLSADIIDATIVTE